MRCMEMKKKTLIASSIATILLAATATTVSGILMTNRIMYIKQKDVGFVSQREKRARRYDEHWFDHCPRQELYLQSSNGYPIRGTFYQPLQTTNTVIICHGVTENKINSMKYIRMYEKLGFNTVVYDHRRHGESGGKTTSYGHYEKRDLRAVVEAVREIIGDHAVLGIHGESMGAATTLLYAGTVHDDADFYISDCSFSDFSLMIRKVIKDTISINLSLAVHLSNLMIKMRDGYSFKEVRPIDAVKKIEKPVLFIHSEPDEFIPCEMSKALYAAKTNGVSELVLFEKGAHAQSFNEAPELYAQTVESFINKNVRKNWLVIQGA